MKNPGILEKNQKEFFKKFVSFGRNCWMNLDADIHRGILEEISGSIIVEN